MRNFLCAGALYQGLHLEVLRSVSSPAIQDQVRKAWAMSIAEHLLALSALSYADRSRQPQLPGTSSEPAKARSHEALTGRPSVDHPTAMAATNAVVSPVVLHRTLPWLRIRDQVVLLQALKCERRPLAARWWATCGPLTRGPRSRTLFHACGGAARCRCKAAKGSRGGSSTLPTSSRPCSARPPPRRPPTGRPTKRRATCSSRSC